ncbi:unnamed protein product, partial [Prorocentrum cordatum]
HRHGSRARPPEAAASGPALLPAEGPGRGSLVGAGRRLAQRGSGPRALADGPGPSGATGGMCPTEISDPWGSRAGGPSAMAPARRRPLGALVRRGLAWAAAVACGVASALPSALPAAAQPRCAARPRPCRPAWAAGGRRAALLLAGGAAGGGGARASPAPEADRRAEGRPPGNGPFTFHAGTEDRFLAALLASKATDPEAAISAMDDFCWHKHWMMNVGDEKGALLDAALLERVGTACGAARAGCDFQALELGTYGWRDYTGVCVRCRRGGRRPPGGRSGELGAFWAATLGRCGRMAGRKSAYPSSSSSLLAPDARRGGRGDACLLPPRDARRCRAWLRRCCSWLASATE